MNKLKKDLENKISNKIFNQIRIKECSLLARKSLACIIRIERDAEEHIKKIDGKLDSIEEEASRHWNHVLALYRTGRKNESYELLMKKINPDWPAETFGKARRFLTEAGFEAFRIKV